MTDLYNREDLSPREKEGFDHAKELHKNHGCIYLTAKLFNEMTLSKFANGGMKYVNNILMGLEND